MRRLVLALVAILVLLSGCGSSGSSSSGTSDPGGGLQGLVLRPAKPAPALALRNYTGQRVTLRSLRGKAVFVTFVYTHCPDVCPLIVADLAAAQRQLGPTASRVRIVAVTVDPKRDTPSAIRAFLAARSAIGRIDYLIGPLSRMLPVWKAWEVGVNLDGHQLTVGHSSVIYGISGSGRMAVVYPANVTPAAIAHDAPLLAKS